MSDHPGFELGTDVAQHAGGRGAGAQEHRLAGLDGSGGGGGNAPLLFGVSEHVVDVERLADHVLLEDGAAVRARKKTL